jgi:diadenosine tetraphosphate (Ap4A) HIT family hydrolase
MGLKMYRSRKTTKAYHSTENHKHKDEIATDHCPFCTLDDRPVLTNSSTMRVFPNKFPYEYWDNRGVIEHLLLVPKRHVESLSELTDVEKIEAMNLMAQYEAEGYSVYWRSKANTARSVHHQHTHLIKVDNVSPHLAVYSQKPYFVFKV